MADIQSIKLFDSTSVSAGSIVCHREEWRSNPKPSEPLKLEPMKIIEILPGAADPMIRLIMADRTERTLNPLQLRSVTPDELAQNGELIAAIRSVRPKSSARPDSKPNGGQQPFGVQLVIQWILRQLGYRA